MNGGIHPEDGGLRANAPRKGYWNRPELQRVLDQIRKEEVRVVWKLDRLSRFPARSADDME